MGKRTGQHRRLRLRLFDRGNTSCPICLSPFARSEVEAGRKVTLEHVPPKALGGQVVCLTCSRCNNSGSRLDRSAMKAKKAIDDYVEGRGTEIEVNFFGVKRSGYLRPEEGKPIKFPIPTKVGQLRGTMDLKSLPSGSALDVNKGLGIKIKRPDSNHVSVSLLRSAYLLVFSLLSGYGYKYAESEAISRVREQIMNPDETIVESRIGTISGLDEEQDLISFQFGHKPFFWSVKIDQRVVLLPCGGQIENLHVLTQVPDSMDMMHESFGHWVPTQFGHSIAIISTIRGEDDISDGELIGTLGENSIQGNIVEWVMVDHQGQQTLALPLGLKDSKSSESGIHAMKMVGENEIRGRGEDWSKFIKVGGS